ncbi:proline--tRNA ligase [Candidatus Phytoplasma melaleucae]|uniref:Proline--tRNA ligase n=1 Tax=Candidatus Phytoplasma melaleucae TaxID=2982630 RepID=A0ABT9DFI2_9MOLU|nr:proline--tRNA ligase ['Melaleuca sp.' phytoplasma]MDO8168085.1 proline--tRNA ligase ['Melaleuca sp.' phytoplasma]
MKSPKKLIKEICPRDTNFSQWYIDVCLKTELIEYSDVTGFFIYLPYSYMVWEIIQKFIDKKLKQSNHNNVYFPLLFTKNLFQQEQNHIQGFAPETITIQQIEGKPLKKTLIIRPTSEAIFSKYYAQKIFSYRDLPKLFNQWCSVIRWEKNTKPFLRSKEFLWQEGHTVHATKKEAIKETLYILNLYKKLGQKMLAIPFLSGIKTEQEKFKGAEKTYSIEALMYDGQALQAGTSHYLGTNFSKIFQIKFQDAKLKTKLAYQTSWGISTRLIGAVIMIHGDDKGLVMPPYIAPLQIIIIPLQLKNSYILEKAKYFYQQLRKKYRVKIDLQNKNIGWKFTHYELKGVPIRLEIGLIDLKQEQVTIFTRYNEQRIVAKTKNLTKQISILFRHIHQQMFKKAYEYTKKNIYPVTNYEEFKITLRKKGYVKMSVHKNTAEQIIKKETGATARIILREKMLTKMCPVTKKKANQTILFARAY